MFNKLLNIKIKAYKKCLSLIISILAAFSFVSIESAVSAENPQKNLTTKDNSNEIRSARATNNTPVERFLFPQLIQNLYPECHKEILEIYEALGLMPLINHYWESSNKTLLKKDGIQVLNQILQEILLRPRTLQRYELNDLNYITAVEKRLKNAYQKINQTFNFKLDPKKLRSLLLNSKLWNSSLDNKYLSVLPIDAALIMGSTYNNYLNRQDYFFDLLTNKKITLRNKANSPFPVYLLGGDRPLNDAMDTEIIPILKSQKVSLNEQQMMEWLFDQAIKKNTSTTTLQRFSTNSPKESQGRPTTAGTLDSLVPMLKDEKRILVISSAPFIRYQKLVTLRQFLKHKVNIEVMAAGPDLKTEMAAHDNLAQDAFIAITVDNLAREVYEYKLIEELKLTK